MEDFLEEIYQEAELYTVVSEVVSWSDCNLAYRIIPVLKEKKPIFQKIHDENAVLGPAIEKMFDNINKKFVVSDLIKIELLPLLDRYLRQYKCVEVDGDDGYRLESSTHGFLTLKDRGKLLHSEYDPMLEARNIGLKLFDPSKTSYSLLGCGLGYIAYQLYYISGGSAKIKIFEPNHYVAEYAQKYGVLSWIPEENLEIVVDQDVVPFLESVQDDETGYYIFEPEFNRWVDDVRNIMLEILVDQNTEIFSKELIEINFHQNLYNVCKKIEELPPKCRNNKCIIVAGGPSLDDNIDFIKNNRNNMTLISVGTSFKKLVKLGLKPDFVTIYDPTKLTMEQLEGVENEDAKLIVATCAYWEWAKKYKGDKYLVPILVDSTEKSIWEKKSKTKGWFGGSTVTIFATRFAEYLKSREIYLVGGDFAFPGDVSHACDTPQCKKVNKEGEGLIEVLSVNGDIVKTSTPLNMYREQMEEFIKSKKDITFYNMSTGGAYIKGTLDGRDSL